VSTTSTRLPTTSGCSRASPVLTQISMKAARLVQRGKRNASTTSVQTALSGRVRNVLLEQRLSMVPACVAHRRQTRVDRSALATCDVRSARTTAPIRSAGSVVTGTGNCLTQRSVRMLVPMAIPSRKPDAPARETQRPPISSGNLTRTFQQSSQVSVRRRHTLSMRLLILLQLMRAFVCYPSGACDFQAPVQTNSG
jgi:hypothetical protein